MSESHILFVTKEALLLVLLLSLPSIVVAAVLGVIVSLVQAVTQVQEQTLSFVVKLIGVVVTLLFTAAWFGRELLQYSTRLFDYIMRLGG